MRVVSALTFFIEETVSFCTVFVCIALTPVVNLPIRVTGHLSEGSFVRNVVVQIPKFDAKPNPIPSPNVLYPYAYSFRTNDPSDK